MRWIWIDTILEYEAGRRIRTIKNVSRAEDHLHDHFPAEGDREAMPIMPASLMIEGMAQTAGILVGLARQLKELVILAKVVHARFDAEVVPGQSIAYEATLDRIDPQGASTIGLVRRQDVIGGPWIDIGRVDLIFGHLDRARVPYELPPTNFVFETEGVITLLRNAKLQYEA